MTNNLIERLEKYPHLRDRFEAILNIVENTTGEIEKADDAEMKAIEEVRKVGSELLQAWASNQEMKKNSKSLEENPQLIRHSKKNYIGSQHLAQ
jgi:hypothetical protein